MQLHVVCVWLYLCDAQPAHAGSAFDLCMLARCFSPGTEHCKHSFVMCYCLLSAPVQQTSDVCRLPSPTYDVVCEMTFACQCESNNIVKIPALNKRCAQRHTMIVQQHGLWIYKSPFPIKPQHLIQLSLTQKHLQHEHLPTRSLAQTLKV